MRVYETIDKARTDGIPPPEWLGHLPIGSQQATNWWNENLANPDSATALLEKARQSEFVANGGELGAEVAHRVVLFGFTLLTLFFLFKDGDRAGGADADAPVARAFGPAGERVGRQMIASVHGTVDGLVLVGLGEGFILGVAIWSPACRIRRCSGCSPPSPRWCRSARRWCSGSPR